MKNRIMIVLSACVLVFSQSSTFAAESKKKSTKAMAMAKKAKHKKAAPKVKKAEKEGSISRAIAGIDESSQCPKALAAYKACIAQCKNVETGIADEEVLGKRAPQEGDDEAFGIGVDYEACADDCLAEYWKACSQERNTPKLEAVKTIE